VLVSIIADKGLANGLPSGHARWLNALDLQPSDRVLHCGCGTGYYTAIIAHVVRNNGYVTAIELEQSLAYLAEKPCATSPASRSSMAMRQLLTRAK
jgi:protein-L-isoaspartate(D-aspartate) O-methyltransferase